MIDRFKRIIPFFTVTYLILYFLVAGIGNEEGARVLILFGVIVGSVPIFLDIIRDFIDGSVGVDFLAIITITGSILLGEYLAGSIILLMISGGEFLEDFAIRKSRKELRNLLSKAPSIAHKMEGENVTDINVSEVKTKDMILVKKGEVIPVDGRIVKGFTQLDMSTLTGESLPVDKTKGMEVLSGSINLGQAIVIEAQHDAIHSKYQQIVELVKRAESEKAPFVRLADKYSIYFTVISLTIAFLAWILSGDPVRGLTVLVVATPCPLILATPIAFTSGISKSAKLGAILKFGGVLEILSRSKSFVFDKTGTLTLGIPRTKNITSFKKELSQDEILKHAASVEIISEHVVAKSIVAEAKSKNLELTYPDEFEEKLGYGILGKVNGKRILIGRPNYLEENNIQVSSEVKKAFEDNKEKGIITVLVATENEVVGEIDFEDKPRENIPNLFNKLKEMGVKKIMMLTGDREEVASHIAENYGISEYKANCLPETKLEEIAKLKNSGYSAVIMVGDGVNDAPALAKADAGIAMGERGLNASTDVADVVIVDGDIFKISKLVTLSKDVVSVATQGIYIGMGLSLVLMLLGAAGRFTPVAGALAQEVIDVLVIINALRVAVRKD